MSNANNETLKTAVADLKSTVQEMSMSSLKQATDKAAENLIKMISDPEGVMATDPKLCLDAYVELSKAENAAVESRRRVVDTLLKAKSVLDPQLPPPSNAAPTSQDAAPEIEGDGATSIFN